MLAARTSALIAATATLMGSGSLSAAAAFASDSPGGGIVVHPPTVAPGPQPEPVDGPEEPDDPDVDTGNDATDPVEPAPPPQSAPAPDQTPAPEPAPTTEPAPATDQSPAAGAASPTPAPPAPHTDVAASATPRPPAAGPLATPLPAHLRVTHGMRLSIRVRAHHGRPTPPRLADARAAGSTSRAAHPVQATRTPARAQAGRVHVVRPGESLWSIAQGLVGRGASPTAIARVVDQFWQLNAATIRSGDPDLIHVGVRLRVPAA